MLWHLHRYPPTNTQIDSCIYTRSPNYHSSSLISHTPGQATIRQHTYPATDTPTQPSTRSLKHSLIHFLIFNQ